MPFESIVERLAQVRTQLDRTCDRLTMPTADALDECSRDFESAVAELSACQPHLGAYAGNAEALAEAWQVRRSFQRASRMLQSAGSFHENWLKVRGSLSGGYTVTGDPTPVYHRSRICLQA